jgi:sugar/nucleoside kinase (ribokinase family)
MSADGPEAALVLVVGDANPDLVLTGDVVPRFGQAEQLLTHAVLTIGGSAAITAHAFARLGRPVQLAAAVGADRFGDQLRADLAAAGVGVDRLLRRDAEPTGLTVVLAGADDRAILTLLGAIQTLTAAEVVDAVAAARGSGLRHVHVSSLFLQPRLAAELPALLAELRRLGLTTSLDTNDDPAGRWAGVEPLLPHLDVLLPNRPEVCAIARITDARRAATELAARGPRVVVVKDGAAGAFAVTADGELSDAAAVPVRPVDTTGAGDTFDAAFLDAWLDGTPVAEALSRATRAGAFAVTARGGTAAQPTRDDLLATAARL